MVRFVKSRYLVTVEGDSGGKTFFYHSLFGNPRIFNREALKFLSLFDVPATLDEVSGFCDGEVNKFIEPLIEEFFVVEERTDEMGILRKKQQEHLEKVSMKETIDHVSLSVSNVCNFGCGSCMFFQRSVNTNLGGSRRPPKMSWEIAKKCIDSYVAILLGRSEKHARIHFGDAEPLLNWLVIRRVLEYCKSLHELYGLFFEYAINTNLSLLNEEIAMALKEYNVKIATSLDGLESANDLIRVTRGGHGTFRNIVEKIDLLNRIGYPLDGISVMVTDRNFPFVDTTIVDFAYQRGMKSIAFDYDLINPLRISIDERIDKIMRLRVYAQQKGIYFGGTWGAPFRRIMSSSMLRKPHGFCSAVEGSGLSFNTDGNLKTCDYSMDSIGHVDFLEKAFVEKGGLYQLVESRSLHLDSFCRGCILEIACGGQCQITREVADKTSGKAFSDMCSFYKEMTLTLIKDTLKTK